ncbi:MAG TPA: protein kinase, partial [Tepidiformaceae bacterium]|nr:protein kinase [Tepidiformaceae bacterium]
FEGRQYLVMEYVEGASLRQVLEARGPIPEAEVLRIGAQIAGALEYAHRQGVVHNDVKPENIIVTDSGVAKVTDFGVAETVTRTLSPEDARALLGTIAYLAPEVMQGATPDARADVYSLGLTLYELLAGRLPFVGSSAAAIASQRLAAPAPPVRTFAAGVSGRTDALLSRAIAFLPGERYEDAGALRKALEEAAGALGRPTATQPPVTTPGPSQPPIARPAVSRQHTPQLVRRTPPPPRRDAGGTNAAVVTAIVAALLLAIGAGAILAFALMNGDDDNGGGGATPTQTVATQEPTEEPTARPTDEPSVTPTPSETASPTASPTRTASPPATQGVATATQTATSASPAGNALGTLIAGD